MAEEAGRDPDSIEIGIYGCPMRAEIVERYREAGVDRVVFWLPADDPDTVLSAVEHGASLIVATAEILRYRARHGCDRRQERLPRSPCSTRHEDPVRLSALQGRRVLVYFYPRADTPGCTTQACGLRDVRDEIGDTIIIGVSPDTPAKLKKFDDKYGLGFTLVSDVDHQIAEKYGVWVEKKNYGKTYMGVQRSAFLIGADGRIERAWPKISPKDTPTELLAALER